jgi:uncharacterized protein with PQ loop repeat
MDIAQMQVAAGSAASLIMVTGTINMLIKAVRTKDLSSYSLMHIVLSNVGNALYWVYMLSLPFGPVWLLHAFYTVVLVVMLALYLVYRQPRTSTGNLPDPQATITVEMARLMPS